MFHLVSLSLQISLTDLPGPCLGLCVGVACFVVLGGFVVGFFLLGKFDLNHMLIPVVDRPCLVLVRQCRKKKDMYAQVREEEQVISPQFTRNQQDVSMRRRKKRKQVEDGALTGQPTLLLVVALSLVTLVWPPVFAWGAASTPIHTCSSTSASFG